MTSLHRIYKSQYAFNDEKKITLTDDMVLDYVKPTVVIENEPSSLTVDAPKADESQITLREKLEWEAEKKNIENMKQDALRIVEEAKAQASEIIKQAQAEATQLKNQIIEEGLAEVKVAQEQGYNDGFAQKEDEILELVKYMNDVLKQTQNDLRQADRDYIASIEPELRFFALDIAKKILNKEIETDQLALSCLTFELLDGIKKDEHITVEVSNKAKDLIARLEEELASNIRYKERDIQIVPIKADMQTLHVNHDGASIDASLDTQIETLKSIFEKY